MAEAVPEGGIERHLQQAAAAGRQHVTEWSERHTAPHFQTDLWFVVTDENGTETRIPACRAILNINCLFLHSFQAGDDVEIPQTICTDALTVVYLLWLNYPRLPEAESPFDRLVSVTSPTSFRSYDYIITSNDENKMVELCLAISKLAKLADWIQCDTTIERLEDIMESTILKPGPLREGAASKYIYMAAFALSDAQNRDGRTYLEERDDYLVDEFPAALIRMNEAERERIADHVVPTLEALLGGCSGRIQRLDAMGDISEVYKDAEALSEELKLLVTVAKFLLNSYEEARSDDDEEEEEEDDDDDDDGED